MTNTQPNLFTRPDTFFGVCQGLGEDLRIHPNLLRLALAVGLFFNPPAAAAAYVAAGLLVLVTRYFYPNPAAPQQAEVEASAPEAPAIEQPANETALTGQDEAGERELERLAA